MKRSLDVLVALMLILGASLLTKKAPGSFTFERKLKVSHFPPGSVLKFDNYWN